METAATIDSVKVLDHEQRVLEGIASTVDRDRKGDILDPRGAVYALPIVLLAYHDKREPLGNVEAISITDKDISIRARLSKSAQPGELKDRLDSAWESLTSGLVRGLSVGYRALGTPESLPGGGRRLRAWEILEVSITTLPTNARATVTRAKSESYDAEPVVPAEMSMPIYRDEWPAIAENISNGVTRGISAYHDHVVVPPLEGIVKWCHWAEEQIGMLLQRPVGAGGLSIHTDSVTMNTPIDEVKFSLERLERVLTRPVKAVFDDDGKLIGARRSSGEPDSPTSVIAQLEARIKALELRPTLRYEGVWRDGETYREGAFATHSGSLWHCCAAETKKRPGDGGADWQLVAKRGRDASR